MAAPKSDSPQQLLITFYEWLDDATAFVREVTAWRQNQDFPYPQHLLARKSKTERNRIVPSPRPFAFMRKHSEPIREWLRKKHAIDDNCVRELARAAETWATEKNDANVPENRLLRLELSIARLQIDRSTFALVALRDAKLPRGKQPVLSKFVAHANLVLSKSREISDVWPPESEERWRFYQAVRPRYTPDVPRTALPLAIAEADRNGRLIVLLPRLKALEKAIEAYLQDFIKAPVRSFVQTTLRVNGAINELVLFMADPMFEPPLGSSNSAEWISASDILVDYADCELTIHRLRTILKNHPEIKTRKPQPQRLEVHIVDWRAFAMKEWPNRRTDPTPADIARQTRNFRVDKGMEFDN